MSETSYEQCHISYRGYMDKEIDTAREVLRKYGKPCVDAVKELRSETDMPMSECANMLRCLWRDAEIEHVKSENAKLWELGKQYETMLADYRSKVAKLRELCTDMYELAYPECPSAFEAAFVDRMRELGMEVE